MPSNPIQHIFVLMLENRAFDHLLGFCGIAGTDAETGKPTVVNGLSGAEKNVYGGVTYAVASGADYSMMVDPGHEFTDVLCQLAGQTAVYAPGGTYPAIDNSGFVASYVEACAKAKIANPPGEIMKCYAPDQLPVLTALAKEFAICDNWHASMPGPTWPNRMFVHAASSAGLDHSPTTAEIVLWETADGYSFPNGDLFDRIKAQGTLQRRLYAGDMFPMMSALKGIGLDDIRQYEHFAADLQGAFPYNYVFIEPSYALLDDYMGSTSEHPLDDVRLGEGLIKATYEAIRNSPVWESSLLVITWDEHGGFYDHVAPRAAIAPGDKPSANHNQSGFTFEQYGPRVPSVIISPWIAKNTIDHRLYDHSSVPATVEKLFGLASMTQRDAAANSVVALVSLAAARTDTPSTLPAPAASAAAPLAAMAVRAAPSYSASTVARRPHDTINDGNLPIILQAAMRQDAELSAPSDRAKIIAHVASLKTRADAAKYLAEVAAKRRAASKEALS